ncbi:MAG: septal ring lytic transglycosylase RlpA family protein [Magnetococcales bacterium]|nr:septal ring lytic transglycosylase RlpA family protein [Magnetococcales bacterium]
MGRVRIDRMFKWLLVALLLLPAACAQMPEPPPEAPPEAKPIPPKVRKGTSKPYVVFGKTYFPMTEEEAVGYVDEGIASWYGKEFHNRPTATGERFDMHAISAAHTTLPLPIMARVTNLDNGQTMQIRVNDRGPFVNNRLIDLSYGAAVKLGYARQGTARVRVEALPLSGDTLPAKAPVMEAYHSQKPKTPVEAMRPLPSGQAPWREEGPTAKAVPGKPVAAAAPDDDVYEPGHYIQVGSFGQYKNAQQMAKRLATVGKAKVTKSSIGARVMYRVRFGPFDSQEKADRIVRALRRLNVDQTQIIED